MILVCFGTRPEYIKIKPLLDKMDGEIEYETLFTGQHENLLSGVSFDHKLSIDDGKNRLDSIFNSVFNKIDFSKYSAVMVQGDTASACAIALTAFNHKCRVIHLEAGMRTYRMEHPWPEETYRQIIARCATLHLCPSSHEMGLLAQEKVEGPRHIVGNTVGDNLVGLSHSYGNRVIVTMHRRENHHNMDEWFKEIDFLAETNPLLEFIMPLHPNPNVTKHRDLLQHVNVVDPIPYEDMIKELQTCKFVITDSGGIQEECSFLKKYALVCRHRTERTSLLTKSVRMCETPEELRKQFNKTKDDYVIDYDSPYGDGTTSEKIVEILKCEQL